MIYVLGAGLAGLAAAVALSDSGAAVTVLESAPEAGGRCRSYFDRALGCRIDNGNHLLLSGNDAAQAWLRRLGTTDTMTGPGAPLFPFMDLATGERWVLRPGRGRAPWWILDPSRRVAGTRPSDYAALLRFLAPRPGATVAATIRPGPLADRLIVPLAISALNTLPEIADASLMGAVLRGSLLRGGAACIPCFPRDGLSESFVDPALRLLDAAGATLRLGCRVAALEIESDRVVALATSAGPIPLAADDQVVAALPPPVAAGLLPRLIVPNAFESILNLHYRIDADPGPAGFHGLVGGLGEWIFVKPGVVSVTISAANRHADLAAEDAATRCWREIAQVCNLPGPIPPHRVVRERRATFAATAAQQARRPGPRGAGLANLVLAGDWTATGLPATIEGALRSAAAAADAAQGCRQGGSLFA